MEKSTEGSLTTRTLEAGRWRLTASIVRLGLHFGAGVILARLIPPDEFGLLAFAMFFVGFADFVAGLGLGPAVVQRRELSSRHIRVAFTLALVLGLATAAAFQALAPVTTLVFPNPDLPNVLRAVSLIFVLGSFGTTAEALLERSLDFRRLFRLDVASLLIGYAGVGVTLAALGYGVWSLVAAVLAQRLVASVLAMAVVRHPVLPLLAVRETRELVRFGLGIGVGGLVSQAARNADALIVGRWLGAAPLGLYGRAYALATMPQTYLPGVLFPAFSRVQGDRRRLGRAYLLAVQLTTILVAPAMLCLAIAAPTLIRTVYGPMWAGAIGPLQILALPGCLLALRQVGHALNRSQGRVYADAGHHALYMALVLIGGWLGRPYGIEGVAWGVAGATVLAWGALVAFNLRLTGLSSRALADSLAPGLVLMALVGAPTLAVRAATEALRLSDVSSLALILLVAAAGYLVFAARLPRAVRPVELFDRLRPGLIASLPGRAGRVVAELLVGRSVGRTVRGSHG